MLFSKTLQGAKPSLSAFFIERKIYALWFLGIFLIYLSFSPMVIAGMGYMGENMRTAEQITSQLLAWMKGGSNVMPILWPRHGAVEMLFEVPFLLLQRIFFGPDSFWADRIMSLQPVLFTSLISVIILSWSKRLTGDLKLAIAVTLAASFATMLWPYAYIALETTQSLFLLLAGFIALNYEKPPTWPRTMLLAVVAGIAASTKSNGFFLLPAIGFLAVSFFWRDWNNYLAIGQVLKRQWQKALTLMLIILMFYWIGSYSRAMYWEQHGSLLGYVVRNVLIESPLTFLMNLWSQFFSLNKGLIFFAPIAMVGLLTIKKAARTAPQLAYFSLLVLAGSACSLSLLIPWQDEVWGPRYLHTAVAPLILCLATALRAIRSNWKWNTLLAATTVFGLAVSFLGSIFYYGQLHSAASNIGNSTIENFLNDPRFNHPRFNLKLLQSRVFSKDEQWPTPERWWFNKPPDVPTPQTVNLRDYAQLQPLMLNSSEAKRLAFCLRGVFLVGGALLASAVVVAWKRKD